MKNLVLIAVAALISIPAFAAPRKLTENKKLDVCAMIASYLDHDQEETEPFYEPSCLNSTFEVRSEDESQVEIFFDGSLAPDGRHVQCTLINEKPLRRFSPSVEDCIDL